MVSSENRIFKHDEKGEDFVRALNLNKKIESAEKHGSEIDERVTSLENFEEFQRSAERRLELAAIKSNLQGLMSQFDTFKTEQAIELTVTSLTPEPYEFGSPVRFVVYREGECYVATYFDGEMSSSGDTKSEAVTNLKEYICMVFEMLREQKDSELGVVPLRQKKHLSNVLKQV